MLLLLLLLLLLWLVLGKLSSKPRGRISSRFALGASKSHLVPTLGKRVPFKKSLEKLLFLSKTLTLETAGGRYWLVVVVVEEMIGKCSNRG